MTIRDLNDITSFRWATVASIAPLRVLLDGDSTPLAMTPDSLVDPRTLVTGSRVRVELSLRKCVIHGTTNAGKLSWPRDYVLRPQNQWRLYSDAMTVSDIWQQWGDAGTPGDAYFNNTSTNAGDIHAYLTSTGIVQLEALIQRPTAPAANTLIANLPQELWPSRTQTFQVLCNGGWATVIVTWDGQILFAAASGGNVAWVTLQPIRWRTKKSVDNGVATFAALAKASAWVEYTGQQYTAAQSPNGVGDLSGAGSHTMGYTIDSEGVMIFEGFAVANTAIAANYEVGQAVAVPINTVAGSHEMIWTNSVTAYGRYGGANGANGNGASRGNWVHVAVAVPSGSVLCIANMIAVSPASALVWSPAFGENGWVQYPAWETTGFTKTKDDLVIARGLWNAGTVGSAMSQVPRMWTPRYQGLHMVASNGTIGRMDVTPSRYVGSSAPAPGQLVPQSPSTNPWLSSAGMTWIGARLTS